MQHKQRPRLWAGPLLLCLALVGGAASAAPLAFITNQGDDTVSVFDLATRSSLAHISVGKEPAGVAVAPAAGRVYISNPGDNTISVVDSSSLSVVATVAVSGGKRTNCDSILCRHREFRRFGSK